MSRLKKLVYGVGSVVAAIAVVSVYKALTDEDNEEYKQSRER